MNRRPPFVLTMFAVVLVLAAGCGGGGGDGAFDKCGNGVVDSGEECDDGNLIDQDGCLATCVANVCGDTFRNAAVEECDGADFGGKTCLDFGFTNQNGLACSGNCTIDTSGCSGAPQVTPTATPTPLATSESATPTPAESVGGSTATATPAESVGAPTATPTPAGPPGRTCEAGDEIVAKLSLTQPYSGVNLFLAYPPSANIPGTGTAASVKERVAFANQGGLTTAGDLDENADGIDDTLSISVVNTDNFDPGLFATVTFDCQAGQVRPAASDFSCTVQSASTSDGTQISDESCTLTIE